MRHPDIPLADGLDFDANDQGRQLAGMKSCDFGPSLSDISQARGHAETGTSFKKTEVRDA
jgi:hypothetical protein